MRKGRKKICCFALVLAMGSMLLAGCKKTSTENGLGGTTTVSQAEMEANSKVVKARAKELAKQVAVTVGDLDITMDTMMMFIYSMENTGAQYEYYYQTYNQMGFWDLPYDESGITMRDVYKNYVMNSAVQYGILYQEAMNNKMTLSDEEKKESAEFVNEVFNTLTKEELERAGFTREVLLKTSEFMTLSEKYYNFLVDSFGIQEEDVLATVDREAYKEYETEYVYLSTSSYDSNYQFVERTEEEKKQDREFMENILKQLKDGKSMQQIKDENPTMTYSERTFLASSQTMDEAYREAAAMLSNGEYSDLVETKYGYYIIKMINNDCTTTYEEALNDAYGAKVDEAFSAVYAGFEEKYPVKVHDEVWGPVVFGQMVVVSETAE